MSVPQAREPQERGDWRRAFPIDEAQRAVQFLCATWQEVTAARPHAYRTTLPESKLTEKFGLHLAKVSLADGRLTGFWTPEEHAGDLEDTPDGDTRVVHRIRKDITYKSNENATRLELTFEFKKLSPTKASFKIYRGVHGMRRFIDGEYDKGHPLALMVGVVIGDLDACRNALRASLLVQANQVELGMVADSAGNLVVDPSAMFPGAAAFDTEHNRPAPRGPAHGTVVLSHVFLQMPPRGAP